jgi:hypothetical protein
MMFAQSRDGDGGQESFFRFKDFVTETVARLGSSVKIARVISLNR